jgi:hypothetical protein
VPEDLMSGGGSTFPELCRRLAEQLGQGAATEGQLIDGFNEALGALDATAVDRETAVAVRATLVLALARLHLGSPGDRNAAAYDLRRIANKVARGG